MITNQIEAKVIHILIKGRLVATRTFCPSGGFVSPDVWSLNVLSLRTFCPADVLPRRTFCPPDILCPTDVR
jgi:hypothetical protein